MKKIRLSILAAFLSGTSVFMVSCGGSNTETEPDESSIQSEDMYEEGDERLETTGANSDTADGTTTDTTVVE